MSPTPDFLLPRADDDLLTLPSRREIRAQVAFLVSLMVLLAVTEWLAPTDAARFLVAAVGVAFTCGLVFMTLALRARHHVGANPPTPTLLLICVAYLGALGLPLGGAGHWLLQQAAGTDPFFNHPDYPAALIGSVVAVAAPPLDLLWRHWQLRQLRAGRVDRLAELERIAFTDQLTGLPNRRRFESALQDACEAAGGDFAVMFFDFDKFKQINDRHGHAVGDQFLIDVAARLTRQLRGSDLAARLGGDEFAVLVRGGDVRAAAAAIAEGFAQAMTQAFELHGVTLRSSASIGIAVGQAPGARMHDVLHAADLAMYQAKAAGGARHAFADALAVA